MNRDVELHCRCGQVQGRVRDASPRAVNRAICYCDDCQAYAHHLGRSDLLDAHGGSDVVQVAPASLTFERGSERIVGLRLTPKGLYRWYASCCNTPLGNTLIPAIPFVGIVAQAFDSPDEVFGKPSGAVQGKYAIGTPPKGSVKPDLKLIFRALRTMFGWRLRGKAWPHPYFDRRTGGPTKPITILSSPQREALRPLCGPHPTASRVPDVSSAARV